MYSSRHVCHEVLWQFDIGTFESSDLNTAVLRIEQVDNTADTSQLFTILGYFCTIECYRSTRLECRAVLDCPVIRWVWWPLDHLTSLVFASASTHRTFLSTGFCATVCKMVRPMLSDRCMSCLCLWRWCIVAKRLDGSRCHLVWKQA